MGFGVGFATISAAVAIAAVAYFVFAPWDQ